MRGAADLSSHGFGLRPLFLNGIEIWAVWRQKLDAMTFSLDELKYIGAFMERSTIENNHRLMGSCRKQ